MAAGKKESSDKETIKASRAKQNKQKGKLLQESLFWWSFFSSFLHSLLFHKVLIPTGHCLQTSGVVVLSFWPGASHPMQVFVAAMSYGLVDPYSRLPYLSRVSLLKTSTSSLKSVCPSAPLLTPPTPPSLSFIVSGLLWYVHQIWPALRKSCAEFGNDGGETVPSQMPVQVWCFSIAVL